MTETATQERIAGWVTRHPFATFVLVAYGISWTLWGIAAAGGGKVAFLAGVFGPMAAAGLVTYWTGGSIRAWLAPVLAWRVGVRWWAYALGLPILLFAVVSLALQLTGEPIEWRLAVDRLPAYAAGFLFVLVLGGAMEELGWRGYGLPHLLEDRSPMRATLIIGLVWGIWHVPVYGPLGFVVPMVLAFFYTYLWAKTSSVLLCIVLHASFTPAQDNLILMAHDRAYTSALDRPDWAILAVYLAAVAILVAVTRGRLGLRRG
ncbi:CPBP family intramembrane glutamic endopeptidase [Kribbella sp. NPDC049174]|uniref:CPBP family intramembrane glutamic endopeptidase n=1 Tax=Kribbella sp. NPDC049174 TaxID=3364112 RepID=UPI00370F9173